MNNGATMRLNVLLGLAALLAGMPFMVGAEKSTVTIKVTVLAPPACVINDNLPVEVNFGDVMTTRVDGNNYRRRVKYTLSCTGASSNSIRLQVHGVGAAFDNKVLLTQKTGLGIALLQGGNRLPINSWLNFTYPTLPVLEAVPVKQEGITLSAGEFSAGATLKVAYQ